jgi:HEAT repeat protein
VVQAAIAAIQSLGSAQALALAAQAARAPSPTVRRAAMRILAYFGDASALEPLLQGLQDADPRVREAALQGLPYLEDRRALEALLEAAREDEPRTRAAAMRALGHAGGDARVQAFLLRGLGDAEPWVRYYACQSLGRLAYEPAAARVAQLLEDSAGQVRVAAVEALSHLRGEQAHRALQQAAQAEEPDVQRAALIGLGIRGQPEDLPLLLSAVGSPDIATRLVALSAMAGLPSPTVMQTLGQAAADPDEQVSTAAIGFLASRPEQQATDILVGLLTLPAARQRALPALAVPSPGRVAGLLAALQTADDELAPLLTAALARLQRKEACEALLQVLGRGNPSARMAAASTLSALGTSWALAALTEAARSDPDPRVRQVCALLLAQ